MNAGQTIEFFAKKAEELKPDEKPVEAKKTDQTVETKTDSVETVNTDKPNSDGEKVETVDTAKEAQVKDQIKKHVDDAVSKLKELVGKNMKPETKAKLKDLLSRAKTPSTTGALTGAGLGALLASLGYISRANDPKKNKSFMSNPALLGALGAVGGYAGGNILENLPATFTKRPEGFYGNVKSLANDVVAGGKSAIKGMTENKDGKGGGLAEDAVTYGLGAYGAKNLSKDMLNYRANSIYKEIKNFAKKLDPKFIDATGEVDQIALRVENPRMASAYADLVRKYNDIQNVVSRKDIVSKLKGKTSARLGALNPFRKHFLSDFTTATGLDAWNWDIKPEIKNLKSVDARKAAIGKVYARAAQFFNEGKISKARLDQLEKMYRTAGATPKNVAYKTLQGGTKGGFKLLKSLIGPDKKALKGKGNALLMAYAIAHAINRTMKAEAGGNVVTE